MVKTFSISWLGKKGGVKRRDIQAYQIKVEGGHKKELKDAIIREPLYWLLVLATGPGVYTHTEKHKLAEASPSRHHIS